jgi:tRNA1(Val) A37 N6-methylase TrmN6
MCNDTPCRSFPNFPRGLIQPEGCFRFSADALLLAAFAAPGRNDALIADLGSGCGVVAFAVLLRHPQLRAIGFEREPVLVAAARGNASMLGLAERFSCIVGDLASVAPCPDRPGLATPLSCGTDYAAGTFDIVLANPPYHTCGCGREPILGLRRRALFDADPLGIFCRAAFRLLRNKGRFYCVFPAARLTEISLALSAAGLGARRLRPVFPKEHAHASLVLLEARKNTRSDIRMEPPLVLHQGAGSGVRHTETALAFCPELARG